MCGDIACTCWPRPSPLHILAVRELFLMYRAIGLSPRPLCPRQVALQPLLPSGLPALCPCAVSSHTAHRQDLRYNLGPTRIDGRALVQSTSCVNRSELRKVGHEAWHPYLYLQSLCLLQPPCLSPHQGGRPLSRPCCSHPPIPSRRPGPSQAPCGRLSIRQKHRQKRLKSVPMFLLRRSPSFRPEEHLAMTLACTQYRPIKATPLR